MSGPSLAQKFDTLAEAEVFGSDIPETVSVNIAQSIALRPYQVQALSRFFYYIDGYKQRAVPAHLLFHMATGSGKTVIMAALILDLYARGHRNFLFFVNSTQIIEKTKANFLDPASSKYLFADPVRFDGKPVRIREVSNFDEADADSINIHFTTIQGLHSRIQNPKENSVTVEDFTGRKIVMISDEAHHLNAETIAKPGQSELDLRASWESTVSVILNANPGNLLLEFTATVNLTHPAIAAKYHDKILYDYSLRQFRADRYSKEIELRRADISTADRMLQAVVLSQCRRKLAGEHGLALKPVILMKSKNIDPSAENQTAFGTMIAALDGERLATLMEVLPDGDTVGDALRYALRDGAFCADDLAREIRLDFAPTKVRNVNRPDDLARQQIELNSLEDRDNEVRVIFAVDKLNEGWDVLNLFDIVRLYDAGSNSTTNQEAQLIGRGARYWPFVAPDKADEPREQRKYDHELDHPLRAIEQLHYHCSHDPAYLRDIRKALVEAGLMDADSKKVTVRLKDSFRQLDFFKNGVVFKNERLTNARGAIFKLADYKVPKLLRLSIGHSGRTSETGAFDGTSHGEAAGAAAQLRTMSFVDLGNDVVRHALDANPFFHFTRLQRHFPRLRSRRAFTAESDFLGGVKLEVRGPATIISNPDAHTRLALANDALKAVEAAIVACSHDHVGTREFTPHSMPDLVDDATISVGGMYRTHWRDWSDNKGVDLSMLDWFAQEDFYGTTEEMRLILFIHDRIEQLRRDHGEVRLIRNEKTIKLYAFDDGAGFEPDFLLFLERDWHGESTMVQIFMEPKGAHLLANDDWKGHFLESIESQAKVPKFKGKAYKVHGLPLFSEGDWPQANAFREAISPYTTE